MKKEKIAIIGLGYVGLPLAIEFGKIYQTIGFDTNKSRVDELLNGIDTTKEVTLQELKESIHLSYTNNEKDIVKTKRERERERERRRRSVGR